jgi:hypothetical protein
MQAFRRATLTAAVAAAVVVGGCTTHQVSPISAATLAAARTFKSYTVYWAGMSVGGAPLTQADSPLSFYAAVGFTMYYGNCESRGRLHDGGCMLPAKITTSVYSPHSDAAFGPQQWIVIHGVPAVVYDGGDNIEIYTDRMDVDIVADSPARAMAAANALSPFNRAVTPYFPAFPQPYYTPNPTQAQLNAQATGATTAIGATSPIGPPAALEPTPAGSGR